MDLLKVPPPPAPVYLTLEMYRRAGVVLEKRTRPKRWALEPFVDVDQPSEVLDVVLVQYGPKRWAAGCLVTPTSVRTMFAGGPPVVLALDRFLAEPAVGAAPASTPRARPSRRTAAAERQGRSGRIVDPLR